MRDVSDLIIPSQGRVLVQVLNERAAKEKRVVWMPPGNSVDNEKPTQGIVVAVNPDDEYVINEGSESERVERIYNLGDAVIFGKFTGTTILLDDQRYILLRESDILAKITGEVQKVEVR
jgi:chaperonin GroES